MVKVDKTAVPLEEVEAPKPHNIKVIQTSTFTVPTDEFFYEDGEYNEVYFTGNSTAELLSFLQTLLKEHSYIADLNELFSEHDYPYIARDYTVEYDLELVQ